jgi:3-phenylpropionate/cinnamic acid dioxygenase small subunit
MVVGGNGDMATELASLRDEQAVLDTLYRYSHCIDYGREEEWVDCFTDDGVWDSRRSPIAARGVPGRPGQSWVVQGREQLAKFVASHTRPPQAWHKHLLCEPRVELSGDRAEVDSYFVRIDVDPTGSFIRAFGRYRDSLVRCPDGRWRINHRIAEIDGTHPLAEPTVGPDVSQGLAIEEIKRLKARYCRMLDLKQWDDWGMLFTEDARMWVGPGDDDVVDGRAAIVERVRLGLEDVVTVHQVAMPDIEITQAASAAKVTMPDKEHIRASTGRGVWGVNDQASPSPSSSSSSSDGTRRRWGFYEDEYDLCADGAWRIRSLRLTPLRIEEG